MMQLKIHRNKLSLEHHELGAFIGEDIAPSKPGSSDRFIYFQEAIKTCARTAG